MNWGEDKEDVERRSVVEQNRVRFDKNIKKYPETFIQLFFIFSKKIYPNYTTFRRENSVYNISCTILGIDLSKARKVISNDLYPELIK